jgi:hypothetical protein
MENRKRCYVIDKDFIVKSIHADRDADAEALLSEPKINHLRCSESLWTGGMLLQEKGGIEIDNK